MRFFSLVTGILGDIASAAEIPIRMYRIHHTIGNTIGAGESADFAKYGYQSTKATVWYMLEIKPTAKHNSTSKSPLNIVIAFLSKFLKLTLN